MENCDLSSRTTGKMRAGAIASGKKSLSDLCPWWKEKKADAWEEKEGKTDK